MCYLKSQSKGVGGRIDLTKIWLHFKETLNFSCFIGSTAGRFPSCPLPQLCACFKTTNYISIFLTVDGGRERSKPRKDELRLMVIESILLNSRPFGSSEPSFRNVSFSANLFSISWFSFDVISFCRPPKVLRHWDVMVSNYIFICCAPVWAHAYVCVSTCQHVRKLHPPIIRHYYCII